jgi:hypothetical protein
MIPESIHRTARLGEGQVTRIMGMDPLALMVVEVCGPETRISKMMYAPPLVLLAVAVYLGLQPQILDTSRTAGFDFADHSSCQARIIDRRNSRKRPTVECDRL